MPRASTTLIAVDVPALWRAVAVRMARLDISSQTLAAELGFVKQTLSIMHGHVRRGTPYQPSAQVFLTLCWWLGRDPRDFAVRRETLR